MKTPRIAEAMGHIEDDLIADAELGKKNRNRIKWGWLAACVGLLGIVAVAKPLVQVLLTDKWLESVPYLMVFCLLRLPGCLVNSDKQVYYAIGKSGINMFYEIGLFILNITTLVATMRHSTIAIAIGATVVEYIGCFTIWIISTRTYGYKVLDRLKDIVKPVVNSTIMAVSVWGLGCIGMPPLFSLVVQVGAGAAVYYLLALLTRDENLNYVTNMLTMFIRDKT